MASTSAIVFGDNQFEQSGAPAESAKAMERVAPMRYAKDENLWFSGPNSLVSKSSRVFGVGIDYQSNLLVSPGGSDLRRRARDLHLIRIRLLRKAIRCQCPPRRGGTSATV